MWSAWITWTPCAANISATTDLPEAMPPVNPTFNTSGALPGHLWNPRAAAQLERAQSVGHEHRDGQRANSSRNWRQRSGNFGDFGMYISYQRRALGPKRFLALGVSCKKSIELGSLGDLVHPDIN